MIAYPLGLFDCCGVSDGSACAIVTTPEIAKSLKKNQELVKVKALSVSVSSGEEAIGNTWDGSHFVTTRIAATNAYKEAGIKDPREEISMCEVHDCFSITEMVTMEDLHISPKGGVYEDIMNGFYDLDGGTPCQVDGGLKCFGHPIGASGLRMIYAMYEQLPGKGARGAAGQECAAWPDPQPGRDAAFQCGGHFHIRTGLIIRIQGDEGPSEQKRHRLVCLLTAKKPMDSRHMHQE